VTLGRAIRFARGHGTGDRTIAATYPLDRVGEAFEELEQRHTRDRIVLIP
jgi:NADPH:quinone reductase